MPSFAPSIVQGILGCEYRKSSSILGRRGTNEFFNPHGALGQFAEECGEDFQDFKDGAVVLRSRLKSVSAKMRIRYVTAPA